MINKSPKPLTPSQVRVVKKLLNGSTLIYNNKYGRKPWAIDGENAREYLASVCALALIRRKIIYKTSEKNNVETWELASNWQDYSGVVKTKKWYNDRDGKDQNEKYPCGILFGSMSICYSSRCKDRLACPIYDRGLEEWRVNNQVGF